MGEPFETVHLRFSRYLSGHFLDGTTLVIELPENGDDKADKHVLEGVPWNSITFMDGFVVQMEKSDTTADADERYEFAFQFISNETTGLKKQKM